MIPEATWTTAPTKPDVYLWRPDNSDTAYIGPLHVVAVRERADMVLMCQWVGRLDEVPTCEVGGLWQSISDLYAEVEALRAVT